MRPLFKTGLLVACPELLETLPRTALVAAIVRHSTSIPIHNEAVVTHHEEGEIRFQLETDVRRRVTVIRLSEGCP